MKINFQIKQLKKQLFAFFILGIVFSFGAQSHEIIPKESWTLISANSQEIEGENGAADNAFDNDPQSIWHSQWHGGSDPMPHEIQIDLGANYSVAGFTYLPRQDGQVNGRISQYEVYLSSDNLHWGIAVATGTFANNAAAKEIIFPAKPARYLRLKALSEVNGQSWISAAEIGVLKQSSPLAAPASESFSGVYQLTHSASGKLLTAGNLSSSAQSNTYLSHDLSSQLQQWELIPVEDNNYQLVNVGNGMTMGVLDNGVLSGTTVWAAPENGETYQHWRIVTEGNNYKLLQSKSALSLGNTKAAVVDGSSVQLTSNTTGAAIEWTLTQVGAAMMNRKPDIIPSIREWTSATGSWTLNAASRICINPQDYQALSSQADAFRRDIQDLFSLNLAVTTSQAGPGDIFLSLGEHDPKIGKQGYIMDIGNSISLRAKTPGGVMFGTRTILQALKSSTQQNSIAQGKIKDYPHWQSRGFMLDVGRMFFPIAYLRDVVKFMSYYKMNEFQLHINDNKINFNRNNWRTEPAAFRLKSDINPGLEARQHYTKQEYSNLIQLAKTYGVTIITEIDTPAHSLAFTQYRQDLVHPTLKEDHLNLSNPATAPFIESVWDEYLGIFDQVHIGTDEYNSKTEQTVFKNYINRLNRFLKTRGKEPVRMWGSQDSAGGAAGVDRDMLVNIWYEGYYNPVTAINDGYDIINTDHTYYIVPKAGYYNDYLNTKNIYNTWLPNTLPGGTVIDINHSQLKGGMFCVWNDKLGEGYDKYGVYDRIKPAMKTFSEKMWRAGTERPYANFDSLMNSIGEAPRTTELLPPSVAGNLAAHRPATSSSNETVALSADKAFDSNQSSRWGSLYSNAQWITVDLGSIKAVNRVNLHWEAAYAKQYKIQTSTNANQWTDVVHETNGNGSLDSHNFGAVNTRYIRMLGITRGTTYGYSLYEFEVYGP